MSKVLKFRIWDKKESEYMCLGATAIDAITGEVVDYYWEGRKLKKEDYIIEQYTGLKDKNGTEVYEGDIIVVESCVDEEEVTRYEVYWNEDWLEYSLKLITGSFWDSSVGELNPSATRVIGNIHEGVKK